MIGTLSPCRGGRDRLLLAGPSADYIRGSAIAGAMATSFGLTVEGFETRFGTNHLGHLELITRLGPLLADGGRLMVLRSLPAAS